jgi:hypothetical protein
LESILHHRGRHLRKSIKVEAESMRASLRQQLPLLRIYRRPSPQPAANRPVIFTAIVSDHGVISAGIIADCLTDHSCCAISLKPSIRHVQGNAEDGRHAAVARRIPRLFDLIRR